MGWFIFLLLTSVIASIAGQTVTNENDESISVEEFEAQLQDEALKVLVQHSDEMSRIPKPPPFDMPQKFMRSFIPGTGVGNREELMINSIKRISVYENSKYTKWYYKRFNNTDYILAVGQHNVVVNKFDSSTLDSFTFLDDDAILRTTSETWSPVKDAAIFTRAVKGSVALYIAILTQETRTSLVNIYEIVGGRGILVSLIDLGISPSTGPFEARKIAFVESQFGSSLVVLINSPYDAKVIPQQKGSSVTPWGKTDVEQTLGLLNVTNLLQNIVTNRLAGWFFFTTVSRRDTRLITINSCSLSHVGRDALFQMDLAFWCLFAIMGHDTKKRLLSLRNPRWRPGGSSELNHYIEVQYPEAVDLVTFTVLGHGYIAVANSTSCNVYKFDKHAHSHLSFDR
ncbi:uncharacterized protein TNCV_3154031 [Trichonephila clavipes]|nr:uncharacterized protein TNCV_3154031 [Trichonephila clavipes]